MGRNKKFIWGSFTSLTLIFIVLFCGLNRYTHNENTKSMQKIGEIYMAEMSMHLQRHFNSIMELLLNQVEGIVRRIPPDSFSEHSQEMIEELESGGRVRDFEYLSLQTTNGEQDIIYGEPVEIMDIQSFCASLNQGCPKIVQGRNPSGEKMLLFGIPASYAMEAGKVSSALVAGIDLDYITSTMSLGVDESLAYSHIIRSDGIFVVQSNGADDICYFDYLLKNQGEEVAEGIITDLKKVMAQGDVYSKELLMKNGTQVECRKIYCAPLPYSDWYMINVMPHGRLDEVIATAGKQRMEVFIGSCLTMIISLVLVFVMYYRKSNRQMFEMERAQREAETANKAKSEFLSNMSHDIRTPMNAIVGMTAIACDNIHNPQKVQDCLKKINLSSKQLLGLINDILDMSKIESGKLEIKYTPLSLRKLVGDVADIICPQSIALKQDFDIFVYDIRNEWIYADEVRFSQVLLNLLSNALKFTPSGGKITVTVMQEVSALGKDYIRTHFWVKDSGIGMSKEFQNRIFESFAREDNQRVKGTVGTGLGMTITKYIVDSVGGTIDLQSKLNKGTEFHIAFDLKQVDASDKEGSLPDCDVLVVNADEKSCHSIVSSLREMGAHAEWALRGYDAIDMVKKRHMQLKDYHIILLDWKMPDMGGIEVAKEMGCYIRKDETTLLISVCDWNDIEAEAREAGISGFVLKPLFKTALFEGLSPYVGQKLPQVEALAKRNIYFMNKRLLVAEDNELNWEIINELLSAEGFILDWAPNGQICVDKFYATIPGYYDAILMDLRMPIMNGFEATKEIRDMGREDAESVPIIAMTADAFVEDIEKCLKCGMNAHVAKPVDVSKLLEIFRGYFEIKEGETIFRG